MQVQISLKGLATKVQRPARVNTYFDTCECTCSGVWKAGKHQSNTCPSSKYVGKYSRDLLQCTNE